MLNPHSHHVSAARATAVISPLATNNRSLNPWLRLYSNSSFVIPPPSFHLLARILAAYDILHHRLRWRRLLNLVRAQQRIAPRLDGLRFFVQLRDILVHLLRLSLQRLIVNQGKVAEVEGRRQG